MKFTKELFTIVSLRKNKDIGVDLIYADFEISQNCIINGDIEYFSFMP